MVCVVFSRETVVALEETVRVAEKAVGRCPDLEPLLITARDRLQVNLYYGIQNSHISYYSTICVRVSSETSIVLRCMYEIPSLQSLSVETNWNSRHQGSKMLESDLA